MYCLRTVYVLTLFLPIMKEYIMNAKLQVWVPLPEVP